MTSLPSNIGKSTFNAGEYVVHARAGMTIYAMRFRKGGQGWETYYHRPLSEASGGVFTYYTARTLAELAGKAA